MLFYYEGVEEREGEGEGEGGRAWLKVAQMLFISESLL